MKYRVFSIIVLFLLFVLLLLACTSTPVDSSANLSYNNISLSSDFSTDHPQDSYSESNIIEWETVQRMIITYTNDYHRMIFNETIIKEERPWEGQALEGSKAIKYSDAQRVLRFEISFYGESSKRIVNIHHLGDESLYIVDLRQFYDIPILTQMTSILDYSISKYIITAENEAFVIDDVHEVLVPVSENDYTKMLEDIKNLFEE